MPRRAKCRSGDIAGSGPCRRNYYGGPPAAPAAYDPTEGVRKRNIIWLGVVILIGFFLPVITPGFRYRGGMEVHFLNFEALGEERVPIGFKLFFLYPGLAGLAVILLAALSRGIARSIVLAGLGALFLIFVLALQDEQGRTVLQGMFRELPMSFGALMLIGLFAFMGLFVGSRARCFRPASQVAAIVGIVGGILYLVTLFIPVDTPQGTSINLIMPFKMLEFRGAAIPAVGLLGMMGCLIAASILCIILVMPRPNAEPMARTAFTLLVVAYVVIGVAILIEIMRSIGEQRNVQGEAVLASFLMLAKMLCWVVGLLLLLPVGLTDLLVNLTPAGPAATRSAGYGSPLPPRPGGVYEDPQARFARLKQLLDDGLITPEEYERKKADLLGRL